MGKINSLLLINTKPFQVTQQRLNYRYVKEERKLSKNTTKPRTAKQNIPSDSYIVIWNALLIVWMYTDLADDSKTEPSFIRKTAIDQTLAKIFLIKTASLKRWVSVCRFKIETWSQRKSLNVNNRNSRNFRITKIFYVKNFPIANFKIRRALSR